MTDLYVQGADGVRLHALGAGQRGPLLLFLHGFPEFSGAWHRQMREFESDHRVVALDLRGYNLSDKPDQIADYALPRLVDDVRRVIGELSPDRPAVLIGHDWGGIVAWTLARESPALLERIVIINAPHPALFFRELKRSWGQRLASSYAGFFQLRGVAEIALRVCRFAALRWMIFGVSTKPEMFPPELRTDYLRAWSMPGALTGGLNYYRNLRALRHVAGSQTDWTIPVPTLVLWGDRDPALRLGNLDGLEQLVPQLVLRRHPTATHWIVHEEPAWINAHIRAFLRRT